MKFEYPYDVTREDAHQRLDALREYLINRHGIAVEWTGDDTAKFTGKYMVVKIDGELTLADGVIHFNGKDPGMLWRKRAIKYLKGKLAAYMDPNTPVEQLPRS